MALSTTDSSCPFLNQDEAPLQDSNATSALMIKKKEVADSLMFTVVSTKMMQTLLLGEGSAATALPAMSYLLCWRAQRREGVCMKLE